jgi:peptide/nickel transport system substrate-binding protein
MTKVLTLAAVLMALTAAATGCSSDSKNGSNGGAGGGAPSGGGAEAPADPGTLRSGGEATIAAAQGIGQLDPYKILYSFESVAHTMMWSALTTYTIDGGNDVQPDLAESWKPSDDFRTFTFTLRPGLKLSDGKPLTSKEVKASLERAFDPKTVFLWAILMPDLEKIEAPDPRTVRITLSQPMRNMPEAMTKIPIEDVSTLKQINRDPVVTGPFKVASFTPDQDLSLVPNENYYGEKPHLDRITLTKAQDNTAAVTSLRGGEIQAVWSIPWTDVRELDGSPDITITTGEKPVQNVMLRSDNTAGVFKNVEARRALAHAIDRKSVLEAIYAGRGIVPGTNDPMPAWSDLAVDGLPPYEFDLDKAKQLFAEAGVGPNTPLTFWAPAGQYTEWTSIGEVLQNDLKKIGITLEIETNEISQFAERFAPAGKRFPNLIVPNIYGGLPTQLLLDWWVPGICECNFDDPAYNEALADAQAAPDDAAYKEALGRAQKVFNEQAPVTVVVQTSVPVGHQSALKNVWIDPTGDARFADAGFADQ